MICPNCQSVCADSAHFCSTCGTALQQPAMPVQPKKGTRWIPALLLLILSIAGLVLFQLTAGRTATARHSSSQDGNWFYTDNGVLYFDESRYTGGSELTVPSEVSGIAITALSENCFANCDSLTTVILPDSLVTIGDGAFFKCASLRGIYIPASVQVIGKEAFYGCESLEAICIHNSMEDIQTDAFDHCNRLSYIFFRGKHLQWSTLYGEFITPYTAVFCDDGSFYQGGTVYD